jgi:hypothetical protein
MLFFRSWLALAAIQPFKNKEKKMKKHVVMMITLCLVAVLVAPVFHLSTPVTYSSSNAFINDAPIYEGDALILDAREYAVRYGVELTEAIYRLELQRSTGDLESELAEMERETFAGLWLQHTPDFRIIVQFANNGNETIRPYILEQPFASYVEVRTVAVTLWELQATEDWVHEFLSRQSIPADSLVDVIGNRVELRVLDRTILDRALQQARIDLPDHVVVVTVDKLFSPATEIFGGLPVQTPKGGCTTGFSVRRNVDGMKGVTTAAHCSNPLSYQGHPLHLRGFAYSGPYDVQWGQADHAFTVRNLVFDGMWYRYVYATKHRDNQSVGEWVCKYGVTTGQTCGNIQSKFVRPAGGDAPPNATATYILVNAPALPGDSGGPVFSGNTAYGTTIATSNGADFIYMAVNYISAALSVSVLTH